MKAQLVFQVKQAYGSGIVEIVIWRVPRPVPPAEHAYKYRLVYPLTIAELARRVRRDYKNVHGDVEKLMEWQAVEKDDQGRIAAPYDEIVVDVHLPQKRAA